MDIDMNTNDYSASLEENKTVVQQEQVIDYGQDFLKSRGISIEEQRDGTKVLRVNSLNGLTPEIIGELKKQYDLDTVHINKYGKRIRSSIDSRLGVFLRLPKDESTYAIGQMKNILIKRDELIGDLQGNTKLSDLEKVILISKRICEGITYDDNVVNKEQSYNASQQESNRARNLNGTLIDGKAVCAGYSDLFYQAMDGLNIPVRDVGGIVFKIGAGHAWNQVQIDGKWYNVDLTNVDGGDYPFLDGITSKRKKKFLASDKEWEAISQSEYLKIYSEEILKLPSEEVNEIKNQIFQLRHGISIAEYEEATGKSANDFMDELDEFNFENSFNTYVRDRIMAKNPNMLLVIYATKEQNIEKCAESMPFSKIQEAVEKVKAYEEELLGKQEMAVAVDEPSKVSLLQRFKKMFNKKDEQLALPEANAQKKSKEELEDYTEAMTSKDSNDQKVPTVSVKDKGNEFREGLKASKEVLEENSKQNMNKQKEFRNEKVNMIEEEREI